MPDRVGKATGDVDLGYLRAALLAEPLLGALDPDVAGGCVMPIIGIIFLIGGYLALTSEDNSMGPTRRWASVQS